MNNASKGMAYGLLGVCAFALTLPVTRFVVAYFDPLFVGFGRAVVAAFFAACLLVFLKQPLPTKLQLKKLAVVALGVVVGFPVFSSWAMGSLPASHGGVVLGLLPLVTVVMAVIVSNERPSGGFWVAAIAGSLLVVTYSLLQGVGTFAEGDVVLLTAMILAGLGYAVGGALAKELGGWQVICWALVVALPFIVVPAAWYFPKDEADILVWLAFLYLAMISQLIAFFLWNTGLALGGVARVSQTQLMQPFITIVAAFFLLGEKIEAVTIAFAIAVAVVVLMGRRAKIHDRN